MCRPRYRSVARLRSLVWKSLRSLFRIVAIAPLYIAFASLTCCLLGAASRYHIGGGGVPRLHVYSSPQNFPSLACGLFSVLYFFLSKPALVMLMADRGRSAVWASVFSGFQRNDALTGIRVSGFVVSYMASSDTDTSANPYHYAAFSVSPVDLIAAYDLPFFEGNVVKYVTRARYKNGRGDLLKALWYLLWCLGLKKEEIEVMVKQVENHD